MKKNKLLALLLCVVMVASLVMPGTWAMETQSTETTTEATQESIPETTKESAPAETPKVTGETEEQKGAEETKKPEETKETEETKTTEATEETKVTEPTVTTPETTPQVKHIDTCVEGCKGKECACVCHTLPLYDRLMLSRSYEEYDQIFQFSSKEDLSSMTEAMRAETEAYYASMRLQPVQEIAVETEDDSPVESEIFYVTVNFTKVADFVE